MRERLASIEAKYWLMFAGLVILAGAIVFAVVTSQDSSAEATPSTTEPTTTTTGDLDTSTTIPGVDVEVVIDESIEPAVETVVGLDGSDERRSVGRSVTSDGVASDFIIGEVVVEVPDEAALGALRERTDIEVVDFEPPEDREPDEGIDVLVRAIDLTSVNLKEASWLIDVVEPALSGEYKVDSEQTAATGVILGRLWNDTGYPVSFNHVPIGHDVDEGKLLEALQSQLNAFEWPYIKSTAPQGIGLDTAWQMLDFHGKSPNRVRVLVIDNGFIKNGEFPENAKIRKGEWGPDNDWLCTNDTPCPYHGTQVALTVAGMHDNLWGTAGVAGPWVQLVVMPTQGGTWSTMRKAKEVIREENIDIVNMSFGMETTTSVSATRRRYDKTFRWARNRHDVVAFASAGNEGIDVDSTSGPYFPCASKEVICVGGMGVDTTEVHGSSNYGTEANQNSVEIYGPFCTYVFVDPGGPNPDVQQGCGTSYSSPFVAGVAALLRVADPSISPEDIEETLFETAHLGGLGSPASGHLRRVDAHMAVARALGVVWTPPTVSIETESGNFPVEEVFSLSGSAESYVGEPLPLTWWSNIDGELNSVPSLTPIGASLSPGDHLIQATSVDRRGLASVAAINITIDNEPPIVTILNPVDGASIYEGSALHLVAYTHDPDIFVNEALPDENVIWKIINTANDTVVWEADGHDLTTAVNPGTYLITVEGTDIHGTSVGDSVNISVLPLEPGWVPPTATIVEPPNDLDLGVGGNSVTVDLRVIAKGVDGNNIAGTRIKWTATADNGYSFDICTGTNFPGSGGGGGGFGILTDCKETEADFGLAPGAVGRTVWSVKATAVDNQGVEVEAIRRIEVTFATG